MNNTDTTDFGLKTKYQTDKTELKKKIPDVTDFVKKTKLVLRVKKQTMTQTLVSLKRNLLTIIMTNTIQLQSLIL